ncbi:NERD domain-containing protein [Sporosarcina sp. PTS2304]|uniref:nuclease-related domain-containing protein n=1 Tax=Sporosarcina sp. PTS2304 TaxID=2283194 RepID=UPI000E0D9221|nr:nuclease-related domain-containing protein [Sporosarcina sp. PTS2304]AXH99498.1 NERD domain-containing protein [Sporosarcina sp. PTS2304]
MAQLVKLVDYISRYENDLTRYPTQFIRLKRYQWKRVKNQWEHGFDLYAEQTAMMPENVKEPNKWFSMFFNKWRKPKLQEESATDDGEVEEELGFEASLTGSHANIEQLKKAYTDQLFQFQLKWASSTLYDRSRIDAKFFSDTLLKQLTLRLPDSFLLFYYPIVKVNKAPVELDIILLSPTTCYCITVLEDERMAAYIGSSDRFWLKKFGEEEVKVLNPTIALSRMEKVVHSFFRAKKVDMPIKKLIISRNGYIDYPGTPYEITTIDKKNYLDWLAKLSSNPSPMKHTQFKAAQAILDHTQTTAMSRLFDTEEPISE